MGSNTQRATTGHNGATMGAGGRPVAPTAHLVTISTSVEVTC